MTILAVSENQGVKTSILEKKTQLSAFLWIKIPETTNCTEFRFLS